MEDRPPAEPRRLIPRRSPFGALVAAACTDAGAAEGLAAAYASMDPAGRRRLVDAVAHDARLEGVSPAVALAALLGVEEDPAIARAIFEGMEAAGGEGLAVAQGATALLAGTGDAGQAVLVRPLYGAFVELFALEWDESGVIRSSVDPLLEIERLDRRVAELPDPELLEEAPFGRAVERVADVLWRHLRRHGQLPDGVEPFADWL